MQNIFKQNVTIPYTIIFYGYNLHKKTMEESEIINPFGYGNASRIIDENRKPSDWWAEFLDINLEVIENEFYVLFSNGSLVKKGRSKFKSSQYLVGDRFKSFRQNYERP